MAGIPVSIECVQAELSQELRERYSAFVSKGKPQFHVQVDGQFSAQSGYPLSPRLEIRGNLARFGEANYHGEIDLDRRQAGLILQGSDLVGGVDYFIRVLYALLAFEAGGFLFHAAGILRQGRAFLFFGHSGSGKTTVARLSEADAVLNDDLVIILPQATGWRVHATPFWNPSQVHPSSQSAPLAAIYRLVQDVHVSRERMNPALALAELVASVPVIAGDAQRSLELLARGRRLLECIPAYRLHFLPEASFWNIVDD